MAFRSADCLQLGEVGLPPPGRFQGSSRIVLESSSKPHRVISLENHVKVVEIWAGLTVSVHGMRVGRGNPRPAASFYRQTLPRAAVRRKQGRETRR